MFRGSIARRTARTGYGTLGRSWFRNRGQLRDRSRFRNRGRFRNRSQIPGCSRRNGTPRPGTSGRDHVRLSP